MAWKTSRTLPPEVASSARFTLNVRGARAIAIGHYEGCVIDESDRVLCFGHGSASFESEDYPPNHFHHGAKRDGSWVVASAVKLQGVAKKQSVRGDAGALFAPCHARELAATPELSGHAVLKVEWGKAGQRLAELRGQAPHVTVMEQSFSGDIGERMRACLVEKGQLFASAPGITGVRVDFAPLLSRALQPRHILDSALSIDMFGYFGCAVTRDHKLACWQSSYAFGTKKADPEVLGGALVEWVEGVDNAAQVAIGLRHTCVRFQDGSVACVGDPDSGAVGPAGTSDEFGLSHVNLNQGAEHLMAGALHTCTAMSPPQIVCWGYGGRGGIGRGATEHRPYPPAPVEALPLPTAW